MEKINEFNSLTLEAMVLLHEIVGAVVELNDGKVERMYIPLD